MTNYTVIPQTLADTPNWLCFDLVDTGKPRMSKPPVSPKTGLVCAKNDPTQFTTLQEALVGAERFDLPGVGFVFTDGFVCVDLDDCFDDKGELVPVAQSVYDHMSETYVEYSPSGNGLHIILRGERPNRRVKDTALGIEVYGGGWYFVTVTGDHLEGTGTDALPMQEALDWLYAEYLPPIVSPSAEARPVDHGERTPDEWLALGLSKDEKLRRLYQATAHETDESSADFALLAKLAYWLNRDTEAMTSAFRASPWVRTKDKSHAKKLERADYLPDSVSKAAALTSTTAHETAHVNETKAIRFFAGVPQGDDVALEDYTDLGNAQAMAAIFSDTLCYTPQWGWCSFDGARWETDVGFRAMEASRDVANALKKAALDWLNRENALLDAKEASEEERKVALKPANALYAHAMKTQSEHGLTAMVNLNKAYMIESAESFNIDPWLLNTPSGVVDLKTSEVMPHDSRYRLTETTAVAPAVMPTPMFDAFLKRIFLDDDELIAFVQKAIGSSLIGKVYNENLIIAHGTGANGKSTLFNCIHYLLGDYATSIDPNLLMSGKPGEQQVGMAMLQGKRFAVAQETEEGQRLRSSMLKRLVSTDTMVAKRLYKDPHEFPPTHMLVLSTNHLPKVSSTDVGTWRRILVLPFMATIPSAEMVTDFHSLLIEREGAGILQWLIDGAMAFSEAGCGVPDKPEMVVKASAEYRSEEDWLAKFMEECCTDGNAEDDSVFVRHNDLYRVYQHWSKNNGEYVRSSNAFTRAAQSAGWRCETRWYDPDHGSTVKRWMGFELISSGHRVVLTQGRGAS